ncbi:MAG: peptidylprolyl isomerase [Phycisphaerae bacterium]|nr:peptidylprolyl isomerase [Phycisphaerae bacterium]
MRFFGFSSIFAGFIVCLFISGTADAAGRYSRNPVLVTVNGVEITEEQVDRVLEKDLQLAVKTLGQPPSYAMRHNMTLRVIDSLMEKIVIGERIRDKRIMVTLDEVIKEITRIARINGMSVQEFYNKAYSTQNSTPTDVKDQIAMALRFDKLIEKEYPKGFQVSDRDAMTYYNNNLKEQFTKPKRVKASHIMIKYPKTDKASKTDVKYAMGKIVLMAKKGADFGKLARKYSQDKKTNAKGGDLGFFTYDMMPEEIAKIAFSFRVGEISDPIEMPYGCHVIKVFEVDPGGPVNFDKVKDEIKTWISDDLKAKQAAKYIQEQMANAKITWASGKRPEPIPIEQPDSYLP